MSVLRMAIMCILGQIADQNYNLLNTNMTTLYWQVFKNLEREFQELADTIYINDAQQEVYSMKIADLLIRTVIEIEALAKELSRQMKVLFCQTRICILIRSA